MATICSDHPLKRADTIGDHRMSERQSALKDRPVQVTSADEHALIECRAPELHVATLGELVACCIRRGASGWRSISGN